MVLNPWLKESAYLGWEKTYKLQSEHFAKLLK